MNGGKKIKKGKEIDVHKTFCTVINIGEVDRKGGKERERAKGCAKSFAGGPDDGSYLPRRLPNWLLTRGVHRISQDSGIGRVLQT